MNWILILGTLCALAACATAAESVGSPAEHKIVFEFASDGAKQHESVLNNVDNVLKALGPDCDVLVIAHGPGLGLVTKTNQEGKRIGDLIKKGVTFAACQNTMQRQKVSRDDLLPGIKTVDSGVAEVIRKQEAGWAYVKSGH